MAFEVSSGSLPKISVAMDSSTMVDTYQEHIEGGRIKNLRSTLLLHPHPPNPSFLHPNPPNPSVLHPYPPNPSVLHPHFPNPSLLHPHPPNPSIPHFTLQPSVQSFNNVRCEKTKQLKKTGIGEKEDTPFSCLPGCLTYYGATLENLHPA